MYIKIEETSADKIELQLYENAVDSAVFTNGIYALPADTILPTLLSGFQFTVDHFSRKQDALIVALNSDASVDEIYELKEQKLITDYIQSASIDDTEEDIEAACEALKKNQKKLKQEHQNVPSQDIRADIIGQALAAQFPDRKVVTLFYDETTPTALYENLSLKGFGMTAIHKWGFGTDKDAPKIEGAEYFENVLAFPFPGDARAICHDITVSEDQSALVKVFSLQAQNGDISPYISPEKKLLFKVAGSLEKYGVQTGQFSGEKPASLHI